MPTTAVNENFWLLHYVSALNIFLDLIVQKYVT